MRILTPSLFPKKVSNLSRAVIIRTLKATRNHKQGTPTNMVHSQAVLSSVLSIQQQHITNIMSHTTIYITRTIIMPKSLGVSDESMMMTFADRNQIVTNFGFSRYNKVVMKMTS